MESLVKAREQEEMWHFLCLINPQDESSSLTQEVSCPPFSTAYMSFFRSHMDNNQRADRTLQSHLLPADWALSPYSGYVYGETTGQVPSSYLWLAKDSSFSALRVPAEANMIVVSRSAMIPETALAAVMQAWVPLLPAWRADSTRDTWGHTQTHSF